MQLTKGQRSESVRVFSSSDFDVQIDYVDVDSTEETQFLKQRVTRTDLNSNQYNLTLFVPHEIDRDFKANVILTHPFTKFRRVLPVVFKQESPVRQSQRQATSQ